MQNIEALRKEITQKSALLEKARIQLKKEFIGIDSSIDEVIENVRSWFTLSLMQEKPAVINLWGLTGVGKTSLVQRLLELIHFQDKTYRFDLGEKEGNLSFRSTLSDLCENRDDSPIAIILDEFQHARTVKGSGLMREEIENDRNRMVWELIDSGKVSYVDWKRGLWSFEELLLKLKHLNKAGVQVKNGKVVKGQEIYRKEMDLDEDDQVEWFYPEDEYERIIDIAGEALKLHLKQDVREALSKLNGPETVLFLLKIMNIGTRPSVKNFTKSIIFILGNIDEAYTMSGDFTADISADEFHERSLKITIPDMKKALKERFRDEQIARLGNIHIIYPALNSQAYRGIIDLELRKVQKRIQDLFDLKLEFDKSVKRGVYQEGVYPTQGARPLFTTIHQMIKSKLSVFLNVLIERNLEVDTLYLSYREDFLHCEFYQNENILLKYSLEVQSSLEKLRKSKADEVQAIAAVHESGHAVLSAVLLQTIPDVVYSVTSDADTNGFVFSKQPLEYYSKKDLLNRVAVFLGGILAEELIFGKDYVTIGSRSDIQKATEMVTRMYKKEGMGAVPINYSKSPVSDGFVYHETTQIERTIRQTMEKARELAFKVLQEERELLLVLSSYLATNTKIEKTRLEEMVKKHCKTQTHFEVDQFFYRNQLKNQLATIESMRNRSRNNVLLMNKRKVGEGEIGNR